MSSNSWTAEIEKWLQASVGSFDDIVDLRVRKLRKRLGWMGVPSIQPYIGFANDDLAWFHGRVLTNRAKELPDEDDNWWDNMRQMLIRFASDEVVGAKVEIDFAGTRHHVTSDHEGYFHLETRYTPDVRGIQPWKSIAMRILDSEDTTPEASQVVSRMLTPPKSAKFGVISDIDDTILHTSITGLITAARLTFLHNARTRKPLPGVAALYQALQAGVEDEHPQQNPIFYVSSSPWNLFDLLEDFLDLNEIPAGPLLLRDLGFDRNKFLKEGHEHKLDKARRIMSAYPELPFVLIGDSGQEDARLYAQAATENPEQVMAIFIRDVDPDVDSPADQIVHASIAIAKAAGVPMHLISNSVEVAELALPLELISEEWLTRIIEDTRADFDLPEAPLPS